MLVAGSSTYGRRVSRTQRGLLADIYLCAAMLLSHNPRPMIQPSVTGHSFLMQGGRDCSG
jgi:hypothetical protein